MRPRTASLLGPTRPRALDWARRLLPILACLWLGAVWAASPLQDQQTISVPVNKSRILDLRQAVARISIADPAIADILVINPKQIYINAKQLGDTNMILWDDRDQVVRQIGLEVIQDLEALKEKLYRLLPQERIRVESAKGVIILSGTVSSPARMDAALRLAQAFSGGGAGGGGGGGGAAGAGGGSSKVINLMQVGGAQQVLLEVKVAEVNRTLGKSIEARFLGIYDGGSVKIGLAQNVTNRDKITDPNTFIKDIAGTGLAALINSGNFYADIFLQAAEEQGMARILAEPNLTTLSGQEAEFLSGGQLAYTATDQNGIANTQFKNYGIQLKFIPFVMDSGLINLKVNVSVSEPGPPTLSGGEANTSILSRGANATVEVPSGQVIAIAGLLSERSRDQTEKFPGLGDVPILGALFRSQALEKDQTELVIFVTPKLANTFNPQQVTLPTDGFVAPTDVEFYLMGKVSGQRPPAGGATAPKAGKGDRLGPDKKGSEGLFGHDL